MAETNTLATGEKKRLHLGELDAPGTHEYVYDPGLGGAGPRFTATTSDPTVVITGDGGGFRLAAIAVGTAETDRTATITLTRVSDGATFDLEVTVTGTTGPEPEDPFTAHLGETF